MRIAVSASNHELSSPVDPRFGRCPYFIFVDPETIEFEAVENPHLSSASGAGIQSAQFGAEKGAKAVLTGSCGPNMPHLSPDEEIRYLRQQADFLKQQMEDIYKRIREL